MDLHQALKGSWSRLGDGGLTLIELLIASLLAGSVGLGFVTMLRSMAHNELRMRDLASAQDEGLRFLVQLEMDMREANQLTLAEAHAVQFRLGSERMPGWDPEADPDGDGLANWADPDDDGDLETLPSPGGWWRVGNDRDDDDDDNDGQVDLEVLYEWEPGRVYRTRIVNGVPEPRKETGKGLASLTFTYWGSIKAGGGAFLDADGDSRVSAGEIDGTPPPNGPGDGSGYLDTLAECAHVTEVDVEAQLEMSGDQKIDRVLRTRLVPPLVMVKRKWQ